MAKLTLPAQELMRSGHAACPGCGAALAMRLVLKGVGPRAVVAIPACCWTVIDTPYPTNALAVATLDNAIEATGASISGLRAAVDALGLKDVTVVGFAGDGGTTDIGLQSLSGMLERGTDAIYIMYDNEAYMNTGIQRSGATPQRAWTTTTPVGDGSRGKAERSKDIMGIVLAHRPPYAATLNPSFPEDFVRKVEKARDVRGPRFLHVFSPCPPGWRFPSEKMIELGRLATDTGLFPLYEVEGGEFRVTRKLGELKPVEEYLQRQGRFSHVTASEMQAMGDEVRAAWDRLVERDAERARREPRTRLPMATPGAKAPARA